MISIQSLLKISPQDLQVKPREASAQWLRTALQSAVALELATIPPYLCARWSIKNLDPKDYVVRSLGSIVAEEMKHLGQVCNLMTAFGWTPLLNRRPAIPRYPGPLPGSVHPGLRLALKALSKDLIGTAFMQIEFPSPEAVTTYGHKYYATIGGFYAAIREVVAAKTVPIVGGRQLDGGEGVDLISVTNYQDALQAIDVIRSEGEGAHGSPFVEDEVAHYYRFAELFWQRKIQPCGTDGWGFCGDRIKFPGAGDIFAMAPVPRRGYPRLAAAQAFNRHYTAILDKLQQAWTVTTGGQQILDQAVAIMTDLSPTSMTAIARQLMDTPRPDGKGNYGPDFRYLKGCSLV